MDVEMLTGKLPVFDGLVVEKIDLPLAAIGTILAGQGRRLVGSPSDATTSSDWKKGKINEKSMKNQ